jgi:type I restriction enzyme R subunit
MPDKIVYEHDSDPRSSVVREQDIETDFLEKLRSLKYPDRPDIRDRTALEANFCEKFDALNRVQLMDGEFHAC